jgi:hypothetical protein
MEGRQYPCAVVWLCEFVRERSANIDWCTVHQSHGFALHVCVGGRRDCLASFLSYKTARSIGCSHQYQQQTQKHYMHCSQPWHRAVLSLNIGIGSRYCVAGVALLFSLVTMGNQQSVCPRVSISQSWSRPPVIEAGWSCSLHARASVCLNTTVHACDLVSGGIGPAVLHLTSSAWTTSWLTCLITALSGLCP